VFVRLLTQHERRVYAYILALAGDWNDADEILQETNVRLWEQFDHFVDGTDFGAWACTIAHYQILTHRKQRHRAAGRFSDRLLETLAAEAEPVLVEADARHRALAGCIDQLSDSARRTVRMTYEGGRNIHEVAGVLGQKVDAVYKALQRARRTLHDCIERTLSAERES
jgi:RNA polymerase sigma-70 factor (ECF subfamily)